MTNECWEEADVSKYSLVENGQIGVCAISVSPEFLTEGIGPGLIEDLNSKSKLKITTYITAHDGIVSWSGTVIFKK